METDKDRLIKKTFNALCSVVIYNAVDVCHKPTKSEVRFLRKAKLIKDVEDIKGAYMAYRDMLKDAVDPHVHDGWIWTYDYWGAECLAWKPGMRAPTSRTYFAGSECGNIMFFDGWDALQEYIQDYVEKEEREMDYD